MEMWLVIRVQRADRLRQTLSSTVGPRVTIGVDGEAPRFGTRIQAGAGRERACDHQRPQLALLGYHRPLDEPDAPLHDWALRAFYELAGSIAREDDRYASMPTRDPLHRSH
jgi:hypothetical protein